MNESAKPYLAAPLAPPPEEFNADALPDAIDTNEPQRKQSSKHLLELFATLYLFASIAGGVYYFETNTDASLDYIPYIIWGQGYLIYLIMAICCNKTRNYLANIKSCNEYEKIYYDVKQAGGYFVFHVECYHYEMRITHHTVRDKEGRTRTETRTTREKVITHTATENIIPVQCQDESGHIEEIMDQKSVIFLKYESRYLFVDQRSENVLYNSFDNFKRHHNRDQFQDASYRFVIPGMVERLAFFTRDPVSGGYFYLFGFLGMAFPYGLWLEGRISRYTVQITKRLTM
jgi:hypothetical protein